MGGLAIGLTTTPLAHGATQRSPEAPLQLRLSRQLTIPSPGVEPDGVLLGLPGITGDQPASPFALRWSEATQFAQVEADAAGVDSSAENPTEPGPDSPAEQGGRQPATPAPGERRTSSSRYGLAPIRWGGDISYTYTAHKADDSEKNTSHVYQITNKARSYILYPWLARVSGDLSLALVESSSEAPGVASTGSVAVTGGVALNLFPISRFPFTADFSASDSRTTGELASRDFRSYRLNLRQSYRPPVGRWRANGGFSASRLEGGDFGQDSVYRFSGGYAWGGKNQDVQFDGSYSLNSRSDGADSTTLLAQANHNYRLDKETRIDSSATLVSVDLGELGTGISGISTNLFQLYSIGTWNPLDSPWRGTAAARLSRSESKSGGSSSSSTSFAATASASYRASPNLSYYGSASVAGTPDAGASSTTVTTSAGAFYTGNPLNFGNYSYNWGLSGNVNNLWTKDDSSLGLATSANHSLSRLWALGQRTSLTGSVGQALSVFHSTGQGSVSGRGLSHNASLQLSTNPTEVTVASIGTSVSDSRTYGDSPSNFRSFSAQISGDWRITRRSSISGNMTWQKAIQSSDQVIDPLTGLPFESRQNDTIVNGSVSYIHTRAFYVRGLTYTLQFSATSATGNQRQLGDPDATRESTTRNLDQRLTYRIGRLDTQLQLRIAEVEGKKNALLLFRVSRNFGAF